ncbi:MAG: hypothetical protein V3U20_11105 [Thermoplasmata archaeon]
MRTENIDRTITTQKEQIDRMVSGAENALKFVLSLKEKDNSKTHRDFLFYNPNFEVEYEDGSKRIVIADGKVV